LKRTAFKRTPLTAKEKETKRATDALRIAGRARRIPKAAAGFANKGERKRLLVLLDKTARECVLNRAGHRCEKCGKGERLQWHHVYTRAILSLRWDMDNLVCLCAGCHLWWHHNPLDAAAWFESKVGAARVSRLKLSRLTRTKQDLRGVLIGLEALARETAPR
jgi:predicted restriction endonuclease